MAVEWVVGEKYGAVKVEAVDRKVECRHAKHGYNPDKLAILTGASLLMLSDKVFLIVCDECGYNGITAYKPYVTPEGAATGDYKPIIKQADSLLAHINGKHRRGTGAKAARARRRIVADVLAKVAPASDAVKVELKRDPRYATSRYTTNQIKACIKIWLKWKATGIKTWTKAACDELEALGFKTQFGNGWNPDQLGSLVRFYIQKPEFSNLKAGPMDDEDRVLEEMVRSAAARSGSTGNHVADNVRITTKPARKPAWHEKLTDDVAAQQQEEEDTVATKDSLPAPTLNFAGAGGGALEPTEVRVLTVPAAPSPISIPAQRSAPSAPVAVQVPVESDFALVAVLEDGIILTYKGKLMGAKPIKGFDF